MARRMFLECRDLGHAWRWDSDMTRTREGGVLRFSRVLRCDRCDTVRRDEYKVAGGMVVPQRRAYRYQKGYQVKGGLARGEARARLFMPDGSVIEE